MLAEFSDPNVLWEAVVDKDEDEEDVVAAEDEEEDEEEEEEEEEVCHGRLSRFLLSICCWTCVLTPPG